MSTNEKPRFRRWTTHEVAFLREHLGPMSFKRVAQALNRNLTAVKTKAYDLGLRARDKRQAYREGDHTTSIHNHPFFGPLLTRITQPVLPRNQWSAFDELRALLFYGVVDDPQMTAILGRTQSALVTRRYYHRWNQSKARQLRLALEHDDDLRDRLDALRESGEPRVPTEFLEAICLKPYKRSTPRWSGASCSAS